MLVAAVLFTIGWRLAVRKQYDAHRWVQTVAVCLNASLVLAWMVRYFVLYIVPEIPARLGEASYAIPTVHAVVGASGLVLGVFVALRGNELVPKGLRFTNYKLFMRCLLYTSDAADEEDSVDLGGRRIIKKKKKTKKKKTDAQR